MIYIEITLALLILIFSLLNIRKYKNLEKVNKKRISSLGSIVIDQSKYIEELEPYKARAEYRIKRINNLEEKLVAATGNKKVLRGRKLIK